MQQDLETRTFERLKRSKYELTLAEFPIFLLSKNTQNIKTINYEDSIIGHNKKIIKREWTVFPDSEHGFGSASTMITFFDLIQIWSEQNFSSQYIRFGSIYNLLKRRGNNFGKKQYIQINKDLSCLLGIRFSAKNAFWDNLAKAYVDVILFRLFDHLDIVKPESDNKNRRHFSTIKASDCLFDSIQKNNFFSTDFGSDFFHLLPPMAQRFALYLSKVFKSQSIHKRELYEFSRQIPIPAKQMKHIKERIKQTCNCLISSGFILLEDYNFEMAADRRTELIIFRRSRLITSHKANAQHKQNRISKEKHEIESLTEDILDLCQDKKSEMFYKKVAFNMPASDIHRALSEVREIRNSGIVRKSLGAIFTSKIIQYSKERGIAL